MSRKHRLQACSITAGLFKCLCLRVRLVHQLTTDTMRRKKERAGSQRSLKALFSILPPPLAVALKVITLQKSLAVIALQQACTTHNTASEEQGHTQGLAKTTGGAADLITRYCQCNSASIGNNTC